MNPEIKEDNVEENCGLNVIVTAAGAIVFAFIAFYNVPPLVRHMFAWSSYFSRIWLDAVENPIIYTLLRSEISALVCV